MLTMHEEASPVANGYRMKCEVIFVQLSHLQPEVSDSSGK